MKTGFFNIIKMFFDQSKGRFMCPFNTNGNQSDKYLETYLRTNSKHIIKRDTHNFNYPPFNTLFADSSNIPMSSAFRSESLNSPLFSYKFPYPVLGSMQPFATNIKPMNTETTTAYNKPIIDSNELLNPAIPTRITTCPSTVVTPLAHDPLPGKLSHGIPKQSKIVRDDSLKKFKACIKTIPSDLANCKKLKDYLHMMRNKPLSITTIQQQKSILLKFCKMSKEPPTVKDFKRFLESKKVCSTPQSLYSQLRAVKRFLIEEFSWDEQQFSGIVIKPKEI